MSDQSKPSLDEKSFAVEVAAIRDKILDALPEGWMFYCVLWTPKSEWCAFTMPQGTHLMRAQVHADLGSTEPDGTQPVSGPLLTVERVREVAARCLYTDAEIAAVALDADGVPIGAVMAQGVMRRFALHPARLESHRQDVIDMLRQLPEGFHDSKGGLSFLNACVRRDGVQWGEHVHMDDLFTLGIALGLVSFPIPREHWSALPGGVPYVVVTLS